MIDNLTNSDAGSESGNSSLNPVGDFTCTAVQQQKHAKMLYGCAFNPQLPSTFPPVLATVGGTRLTIYMFEKDGSKSIFPIVQYQDPCKDESLYALAWTYCKETNQHGVVIGGERGIIRVVDSANGKVWKTLVGHGGAVNDLRASTKDSKIVASASKDLTVRIWNVHFSECIAILGGSSGHGDQVLSIDFHESCEYLVSGSMDHSVMVWDIGDGTDVGKAVNQSLDPLRPRLPPIESHFPVAQSRDLHANYVDCVRFVGPFIISKSCESNIIVWKFGDLKDGPAGRGTTTVMETFASHMVLMKIPDLDTWFVKLDVDVDRRYLVCGTQTGNLRFWRLDKGLPPKSSSFKVRASVKGPHAKWMVRQVVFSHTGNVIAAVGSDGIVARFDRI